MKIAIKSVLVFCLLMLGCSQEKQQTDRILTAITQLPNIQIRPEVETIFIIADNACIPCNQKLSDFAAEYVSSPKVIFIITAHQERLDLEDFVGQRSQNIFLDSVHTLENEGLVKASTVLFLANKRVDTLIEINISKLEEQMNYIKNRLGKK